MKRALLSALFSLVCMRGAYGIPEQFTLAPAPDAPHVSAADYNFEGIVGLSGCSGSIIRFDDSRDSDFALVLTNGHCVRMLKPGEVVINQAVSRSFDVLDRGAKKIGKVTSSGIMYATMTKTDMALYQLKETYQDIQNKFGFDALVLSRNETLIHTDIEIISGYWKRGYSCQIELIVYSLKEGDWLFQDAIRYSRGGCETVGGTSGSPVIDYKTREVIAVNNTGNDNGGKCTRNNPCEIDKAGNVTYQKGYSYGQQTYWIYSCLNDHRKIDVDIVDCQLPRPGK